MKNIAVITARGGSKRIPRKNIRNFCGIPIVAYSIQVAVSSGLFDEVMVSTDDEEIKAVAIEYGANVPFLRSAETSNDFATTGDVLMEVLKEYQKRGNEYTYLCCIYPTAPFITSKKLEAAMQLLYDTDADSVIPVVPFSFPPQRGFLMDHDFNIHYQYPVYELSRTQDLETIYHDCGQFYCANVQRFMKTGKLIMPNTKAVIMNEMEVQDIDNDADWEIAEIKYRLMSKVSIE